MPTAVHLVAVAAGLLAFAPAAACGAGAAEDGAVSVVDLSGNWTFTYTPTHGVEPPALPAYVAEMCVPGCWDDRFDREKAKGLWPNAQFNPDYRPIHMPMADKPPDASLPFLCGTGWYHKRIEAPVAWKGRQVTLRVGRVVMEAWVYLNGRQIHHHLGHSTGWEVPLGPHLIFGQANDLVIAVDNTRKDRVGTVIRGWQGRSGGIFGPISIHVAGATRIADLYVYPEGGRLYWQVDVQGDLPQSGQFEWRISDAKESRVLAERHEPLNGRSTRWRTDTFGMACWSDRDPNLHRLEVTLRSGDNVLDTRHQPFGLRRLTVRGMGLLLNDHPIFLRGICDCAYFPLTCTTPTDVDWYRNHIRRVKEVGFNWLRCHTWVPPEPYLQAADELGMLIQVEPPFGYTMTEWIDILKSCRRHPSVVIYCCGNEELLDEPKIAFLRRCAAELRTTVPDALFNPQEALRGVEYGWSATDQGTTIKDPFPHNASRLAQLSEFSDVYGQYAWGWLSYTSLQGNPEAIDRRLSVYNRPCLSHELGICGCYLDLRLEERYRNTRIGPGLFSSAREALRQSGLLDRADLYYRNSCAWQRLMLKDAMETARACTRVAGYDCLGANDNHWHRTGYGCGVLNEFDELKPGRTIEDILGYNGESVLLISRQRDRNLRAGEPLQRDIYLSWFGLPSPIRAHRRVNTLRWTLTGSDGRLLADGKESVPDVERGTVKMIASIDAPMPRVERAIKATLRIEFSSEAVRIRNRWGFWLFPGDKTVAPANVRVISSLGESDLELLADGGRMVLLGHGPFPSAAVSFQMGLAGRPQGNLATVIARHPLTERFPHDGYCDWQFYPMLSGNAAAVQFEGMPEAFDPIIEVVSSYKQIRRQAAMFEWRVGQGRLLVCSLNLAEADPAAVYLRGQILDYASGDSFHPKTQVPVELVTRFFKTPASTPKRQDKTDKAFDDRGQLPRSGAPSRPRK